MEIQDTALPEVKKLAPRRFADARGWFSETFNARAMAAAGIETVFIQDNQSHSVQKGTVRGLHYQAPPDAQAKLVRVLRGAILDVAVDVRVGSPHYGRWVAERLTAEGGEQLWVPRGFLHGFLTLEDHTDVAYKVDAFYAGGSDGSVRFDDPDLAIDWGIQPDRAVLSAKDEAAPSFRSFHSPFLYGDLA